MVWCVLAHACHDLYSSRFQQNPAVSLDVPGRSSLPARIKSTKPSSWPGTLSVPEISWSVGSCAAISDRSDPSGHFRVSLSANACGVIKPVIQIWFQPARIFHIQPADTKRRLLSHQISAKAPHDTQGQLNCNQFWEMSIRRNLRRHVNNQSHEIKATAGQSLAPSPNLQKAAHLATPTSHLCPPSQNLPPWFRTTWTSLHDRARHPRLRPPTRCIQETRLETPTQLPFWPHLVLLLNHYPWSQHDLNWVTGSKWFRMVQDG